MALIQAKFTVFTSKSKAAGERVVEQLTDRRILCKPKLLYRQRFSHYAVEVAIGTELAGPAYLQTLLAIDAVVLAAMKQAATMPVRRRRNLAAA